MAASTLLWIIIFSVFKVVVTEKENITCCKYDKSKKCISFEWKGHCVPLCEESANTCPSMCFMLENTCVKQCPEGTFTKFDPSNNKCNLCIHGCDICFSSHTCLICKTGYSLHNDKCIQECPEGLVMVDGVCIEKCLCNDDLTVRYQDKCLKHCPNNTLPFENECVESGGFGFHIMGNEIKCMNSCQSGYYQFQNECLIECPLTNDTTVKSFDKCLVNCPDKKAVVYKHSDLFGLNMYYNDTIQKYFSKRFIRCVSECDDGMKFQNNNGVPMCVGPCSEVSSETHKELCYEDTLLEVKVIIIVTTLLQVIYVFLSIYVDKKIGMYTRFPSFEKLKKEYITLKDNST